ncbi:hypothetical protein L1F30_10535 [Simiduia sp. 21SJ11W-1]|uniref:hypothetical protein n=1 Tax=Simiduia sp. 21SJ11W-1 TaxID=2909669 RepID=UPI0020A08BAE|nr:hypothetical protein [Simiduia sp. 21SJ11W-1]UTA46601.1 hypothetical protein L1F30_10535 [Simiduia sp. 21SJ11W-1]
MASGLYLAINYQMLGSPWLEQKLLLVLCIVVPLEIADIALGNWLAAKVTKKLYAGNKTASWERRCLSLYHGAFTKLALAVLPLTLLVIMYLATSKTAISF